MQLTEHSFDFETSFATLIRVFQLWNTPTPSTKYMLWKSINMIFVATFNNKKSKNKNFIFYKIFTCLLVHQQILSKKIFARERRKISKNYIFLRKGACTLITSQQGLIFTIKKFCLHESISCLSFSKSQYIITVSSLSFLIGE